MADGAPTPRGRGAALMAALKKKQEQMAQREVGAPAGPPSEEPPKAKGRAALLKSMLARKVGGSSVSVTSAESGPSTTIQSTSTAPMAQGTTAVSPRVEEVAEKLKEVSLINTKDTVNFQGTAGRPLRMSANYIQLKVEPGRGVFEYEVIFNPELDAKSERIRMVGQMMRGMASAKVFDGGSCLYLPTKVTEDRESFTGKLPGGDMEITVTIIYKRQKSFGDRECLHLYNVLFKRIMHILLYSQMGRSYFSTQHKHLIPQHKLEILPGFAVSVDELEGGLMLCLDTQHKVTRTESAWELMTQIRCSTDPRQFKETVTSNLLGSIIFTKYNNLTYRVDDILWDMSPKDSFPTRDGGNTTFIEYYKAQRNIKIEDVDQPLLLHRKTVRVSGSAGKEDKMICLVPELSYLTGLTDTMRSDFKVMKDVAQYTRVSPQQRIQALRKYLEDVSKCQMAQDVLKQWGLSIANGNMELEGRQLDTEEIYFGRKIVKSAGPGADWNRELGNNPVTCPVDLTNWVVFFTAQDQRYANDFAQHMQRLAQSMGCSILAPRMEKLPNDQTSTYANVVKQKLNPNVQVAVFICPSMRSDRYSVIKKMCSSQLSVASQVINSRTLSKPDKVRSIILKIALQINCKLGGSLWTVRFPFKGWMICGIDVYHGSPPNSVCGFVSSINESVSRWYSTAVFQTKELGDFYKVAFTKAIEQYKNECASFPSKVVIIRDGVSDGQLDHCLRYEIPQFEYVLKEFDLKITICFVVVQKRINTRMFNFRNNQVENPPPGTILDHTVTRKHLPDFYLVPQSVRQGTVNPTHYIVLYNTCQLKPDHVQRLCYKLCHLYYNWPGTIRVPAPCQYAHKLAAMVGQVTKCEAAPFMNDKLWYL